MNIFGEMDEISFFHTRLILCDTVASIVQHFNIEINAPMLVKMRRYQGMGFSSKDRCDVSSVQFHLKCGVWSTFGDMPSPKHSIFPLLDLFLSF